MGCGEKPRIQVSLEIQTADMCDAHRDQLRAHLNSVVVNAIREFTAALGFDTKLEHTPGPVLTEGKGPTVH